MQSQFENRRRHLGNLVGDQDRSFDPPGGLEPEQAFEWEWARCVLRSTLQSLRIRLDESGARCVLRSTLQSLRIRLDESGHAQRFDLFVARYFPPRPEDAKETLEQVAQRFGLGRNQAKEALRGLVGRNGRFIRLLRMEVRDQVGWDGDVDAEIDELCRILPQILPPVEEFFRNTD